MSTKLGYIDGGKTSQEGLGRFFGNFIQISGVVGSNSMKVSAAVSPDNTVKVAVGDCLIGDSEPSASTFFYPAWVTSQESVTITANSSGNPRVDCIVAYIDKAVVSNVTSDNPGVLKFKDVI